LRDSAAVPAPMRRSRGRGASGGVKKLRARVPWGASWPCYSTRYPTAAKAAPARAPYPGSRRPRELRLWWRCSRWSSIAGAAALLPRLPSLCDDSTTKGQGERLACTTSLRSGAGRWPAGWRARPARGGARGRWAADLQPNARHGGRERRPRRAAAEL
jgi:hypothetical protein